MNPTFKLLGRLHVDGKKYLGVLRSAIWRALSQEHACLVWINPHLIGVIWNQIGLAAEPRHPKAVVRIGREKRQKCRRWMRWSAYRHMQFVRCNDVQLRI